MYRIRFHVRGGLQAISDIYDALGDKTVHTKVQHQRVPVEEYLKTQERFNHLFEPTRNEVLIAEIQQNIDAYLADVFD